MRVAMVTKLGHDLERGPQGGTFRRRRTAETVDETAAQWVCARVAVGREFAVADDLAALGFLTFAPHGVRVCKWARVGAANKRGVRERDFPVFGPYVFVGERDGLLVARRSHPHLVGIVANAGGGGVPAAFIRVAADMWLAGRWDGREVRAERRFKAGEAVRVTSGPFERFEAIVEAMPSDLRTVVRFALFGRETRVEVDSSALETA